MVRSLFYIWSLVLLLQLCTALHYQWDGMSEPCTIENEYENGCTSEKEYKSEKDFFETALLPVFLMPFNEDSLHYIPIHSQSLIHFCARCISPPPEFNHDE
jgi:hypothetical protein